MQVVDRRIQAADDDVASCSRGSARQLFRSLCIGMMNIVQNQGKALTCEVHVRDHRSRMHYSLCSANDRSLLYPNYTVLAIARYAVDAIQMIVLS